MRIGAIDVHPIADGTFRAGAAYFGDHVTAEGHRQFFDHDGQAWLPIGCFLIRTADRIILIDAGMGPALRDDGVRRLLVGGQLPLGLRAIGVMPEDIDTVVCIHLHADHCGWLFHQSGMHTFPNADIWVGTADWHHFVLDPGVWMFDHIRSGLLQNSASAQLHLISRDTTIARESIL